MIIYQVSINHMIWFMKFSTAVFQMHCLDLRRNRAEDYH